MALSDIPDGSRVLLDPSVFLLAITTRVSGTADPSSSECYWLLQRCRTQAIQGIVSTISLTRLWKQLEAIALLKTETDQDEAVHQTIVKGVPSGVDQFDFAGRVLELATSSLCVATIERQDFSRAIELTRGLYFEIDSALSVAAVEREYGASFAVATATENFDHVDRAGRCQFEVFRAGDVA